MSRLFSEENIMSNFRTLHCEKFDNMKVTAFYEYKIRPIEIIFNVSFSVKPTPYAREYFKNDIEKFIDFLQDKKLGIYAIFGQLKEHKVNFPKMWRVEEFCGVNYTYEHDISVIKFGNRSSLGIDIIMIPFLDKRNFNCVDLQENSKRFILKLKELNNFRSDRFITIKASRKGV